LIHLLVRLQKVLSPEILPLLILVIQMQGLFIHLELPSVLADAAFVIGDLGLVVEIVGDWCNQIK
jgi:hypothetical protein